MTPASGGPQAALPSSFRDPSGFLFRRDGALYRQVSTRYREAYDRLMTGGLYAELVEAGLLVRHEEADVSLAAAEGAYKVLRPVELPFISFPYEWCFRQLQDAALTTLEIQRRALAKGMWLKDASAYNIQFLDGRSLLIDTLSFEPYPEGQPWVAYRQFCQHFLAPLALMSRTDIRLGQLSRVHLDGVPLDLASRLLPRRTWFSLGLAMHLHAHAKTIVRYSDRATEPRSVTGRFSRSSLEALVQSLTSTVRKLTWRGGDTEWADYYEANNNYSDDAMKEKIRLVGEMLDAVKPATVWDLGANTGRFSRLASERGAFTVAWDIDPSCVEANYRQVSRGRERNLMPLLLDLTNPSPPLGWANAERDSVAARGAAGMVLALGLIHHLAIANNVPLPSVASYLAGLGKTLVIEFVPKEDSQVRKLLSSREDIFDAYHVAGFEAAFRSCFEVERVASIPGSQRTLYLMKRK